MAYTSQTNAVSPTFGRINEIFTNLMERRAKYRVYRQTLNELSTLSSRDLADLGMSRGSIQSVAYQAAYK